ncbi:acyl-CoA carboxylase subunit epsilon [Streptomyces sp. NBC_00386]|jgi:hypothetical protein|uniref:acyl-CoA carboxylase epsilon subunit n=1 Tax=Streptomyces sp. NBC_00386 TaxID=2975734 RepID=UPI002E251F95
MGDRDRGQPALRVERGTATEEELAALAVVLLALRGRRTPVRPAGGSCWWLRGEDRRGVRGRR